MKKLAKKVLILCLALLLILPMAGISASAQSPLEITADAASKTIRIQGDLSDLGVDKVSLIIMEPAFTGTADEIWDDADKIVALEQVALDEGKIDKTVAIANFVRLWEDYRIFINGDSVSDTIRFTNNSYQYTVNTGESITLPITLEACEGFVGMTAALDYDSDLLTLTSISPKPGFFLFPSGSNLIVAHETGAGLDGTVVVGYATFTAKADLPDDISTLVRFPVNRIDAYGDDALPTDVDMPTMEVTIIGLPPMPGDVNLDGKISLADAVLVLQYISQNTELSGRQLKAADITGDSVIDTADAIVIMQKCL